MRPRRNPILLLSLLLVLLSLAPAPHALSQGFDEDLSSAWTTYNAGKYNEAVDQLLAFNQKYATDPLLPQMRKRIEYLLTLCNVRLGRWEGALGSAGAFAAAEGEPLGAWVEEIEFWKGVAHFRLGQTAEARSVFERFVAAYPASAKLFATRILLGSTYLADKNYVAAADFFAGFRKGLRGTDAGRVLVMELLARVEAAQPEQSLALVEEGFERLDDIPEIASYQLLVARTAEAASAEGRPRDAVRCLLRVYSKEEIRALQTRRLEEAGKRLAQMEKQDPDGADTLQMRQLIAKVESDLETLEAIPNFDSMMQFRLAAAFLSQDRFRETAFVLERMIQELPADPIVEQASDTLIRCHMESGRWDKVAWFADRFAEKFPNSKLLPGVLVLQGQARQELREFDAAGQSFERVLRDYPDSPMAPNAAFLRAFTPILQGNYPEAARALGEVADLRADDPIAENARFWQGEAFSMARQPAESIGAMEAYLHKHAKGIFATEARYRVAFAHHALREFDKSVPMLEEHVKAHPADKNTPEAWLLLGDAALASGEVDRGIELLRKVPRGGGSQYEEAWFRIGKALRLSDRFDEMREHFAAFQKELSESVRLAEAVYWQGWSYREDEEKRREVYFAAIKRFGPQPAQWGVSEMISALVKMSAADPDALNAQFELLRQGAHDRGERSLELMTLWGQAQIARKKEPYTATAKLRQASKLADPKRDNPLILTEIADAIRSDGALDTATELYTAIRRWNPVNRSNDRVFTALGEIALDQGQPQKALDWFDRFFVETGDSALEGDALLGKARALKELKRSGEAINTLEQLLAARRVSKRQKASALVAIGDIEREDGRSKRAVAYYQRVFVLYGAYPEAAVPAYVRSGAALEELGDPLGAARTYLELLGRPELELPSTRTLMAEATRRLEGITPEIREQARLQNEAAASPAPAAEGGAS